MKTSASIALYTYWNEVRGNRVAPRRFEIEPARLAPILPDAFILERVGDLTVRYRLAGTRILDQFGFEFRGASFFQGFSTQDRQLLERLVRNMTVSGGGLKYELVSQTFDGREVRHECLLLPLVHVRDTVDRFVGVISALEAPEWLGQETLTQWRIDHHEVVWPDGTVPDVLKFPAVAPFDAHMRAARIVRSNKRQFRVYEGGLAKDPK